VGCRKNGTRSTPTCILEFRGRTLFIQFKLLRSGVGLVPIGVPAGTPTAPSSPIHFVCCFFVHFRRHRVVLRDLGGLAILLVDLILLRPAHIGLVVGNIRKNVIGLPTFLNQGVMTLKPAATREFSVLWVLAQLMARVANAATVSARSELMMYFMVLVVGV
jgi:hypothetical protein